MNNNTSENSIKYLDVVLKYFFDPEKTLPKCSDLMQYITDGLKFDEFIRILQENDKSKVCGKISDGTDFKVHCKTCELTESMALCIDCFKNGDHLNHEYYFSLASENFICHCGDPLFLPTNEFCNDHKVSTNQNDSNNNEILKYADVILPHLLYRLLQSFREEDIFGLDDFEIIDGEGSNIAYEFSHKPMETQLKPVFDWYEQLTELSKGGQAIKRRLFNYLTDETFYKEKIVSENLYGEPQIYSFQSINKKLLKKVQYPKEFLNYNLENCECKCMLDELMLWWMYTKASKSVKWFMFSILPTGESFTNSFVSDEFINLIKFNDNELRPIDYYFSYLCKKIDKHHIYEICILRIYNVFGRPNFLIPSILESDLNQHLVVDINNIDVESDLYNTFQTLYVALKSSHKVHEFIEKRHIFTLSIQLLSHLQGVLVNVRNHEYENFYEDSLNEYIFATEYLISKIVWMLINSLDCELVDGLQQHLTHSALDIVKTQLLKWLESIEIQGNKPNRDHLTFHLPLHRHYSIFLYRAIFKDDMSLSEVLSTDTTTLLDIVAHPLQIQVGKHEIQAGLWSENGEIMTNCTQYYSDPSYCKSFMDADLFLIQCIACKLDPDIFVKTIFDRFQVLEFCDGIIKADEQIIQNGEKIAMLNGTLILISQIIYRDISLALKDKNSTQNEVINILSYEDYSFSGIDKRIPLNSDIKLSKQVRDDIVKEVADLVQPKYISKSQLKNAKYILKEKYWMESYDPLYYMFYRSYKDESDVTFERYSEYVRSTKLYKNGTKLVLPFRLPSKRDVKEGKLKAKYDIANSRTLQYVLFMVLYQRLNSEMIDDKTFYLALYLIELALLVTEVNGCKNEDVKKESNLKNKFDGWFSSDNILVNMCKIVPYSFISKKNESEGNLEENMISLLLKVLYRKTKTIDENGTQKQAKFKFNSEISESRIGDECYFINNILNKAANLCSICKHKINDVLTIIDKDHKCVNDDESEKHNKAEKRKNKLLQKMSNMQKNFMEKSGNKISFQGQISQSNFDESDNDSSECYICGNSFYFKGLLCLVRSSHLIGLCDSSNVTKSMNDPYQIKETTLFYKEKRKVELLKEAFSEDSIKQSVDVGFNNGVYVITCGHYMGIGCPCLEYFNKFVQIYSCPVCKQNLNTFIPIIQKGSLTIRGENMIDFIEEILSTNNPNFDDYVLDCYKSAVYYFLDLMPSPSDSHVKFDDMNEDDAILLITSLLRVQLEVNYLQNRIVKVPYFDLLSALCQTKCCTNKAHLKLWHLLTRTDNYEFNEGEVPMLLKDPITIVLLIILNWPGQIHRETFGTIANVVFNLTYIQNTVFAILQLDDEEGCKLNEACRYLMEKENIVIKSIDDYFMYVASKLRDINNSKAIMSSQQVLQSLDECKLFTEKLCLPYLRLVSLLQCYLFGDELTYEDTFDSYIKVLNIYFDRNDSNDLLNWYGTDSTTLLDIWFDQLLFAYYLNMPQVEGLLSLGSLTFKKPTLIELPHLYTDLIFMYKNHLRDRYGNVAHNSDFAFCLFCGQLVEHTLTECFSHMEQCGIDSGIYLSIRSSFVVFYVDDKWAYWSSVYLDSHGEEDKDILRGGQLYLSQDRYDLLKEIWISHQFKNFKLEWHDID